VADFGLALMSRRFPPPWTVEETDACFIVKDHTGHSLAYVYFEEEPGRRAATRRLYLIAMLGLLTLLS
jgi:hypothetical protein